MAISCEAASHLEAVDVGELDVQQYDVGTQIAGGGEGGGAIGRLPYDVVAVRLEDLSGPRPEVRMVVHDQDARSHDAIVLWKHAAAPQG